MPSVTRRGLLVLGGTGAAGVVLAGCGSAEEPRDESDTEQLTAAEAEAEANLSGAYAAAAQVASGKQRADALESFAEAAKQRSAEFGDVSPPPAPDGGPDEPEALSACQHLANEAIAAHLQAARLIDEVEDRALATSSLAACAAELAAVNGFAGEPEVPSAFVTGGPEEPLQSFDRPDSGDESSTTSSTSSSTTDTAAEQ